MVRIPVSCPECGLLFEMENLIRLAPGAKITRLELRNNSVRCPNCGGLARMADGVFNASEHGLEVLSATPLTLAMLKKLRDLADAAAKGGVETDAAVEEMSGLVPAIRDWYYALPVKGRRAALHVLVFVLSVIMQQWVSEMRDDSATPQDVREITHDEIVRGVEAAERHGYQIRQGDDPSKPAPEPEPPH